MAVIFLEGSMVVQGFKEGERKPPKGFKHFIRPRSPHTKEKIQAGQNYGDYKWGETSTQGRNCHFQRGASRCYPPLITPARE